MLQPVERGLAREHGAIGAAGFELTGDEAQHRIAAQRIVIVQVLIAKRNAVDTLGHKCFERVLDISSWLRASRKQAAACRDRPMTRSVCRNSSAPAFEVIAPPSNDAVTLRLPKPSNPSGLVLQSVSIGCASGIRVSLCCQTTFSASAQPMYLAP